MSAKEKQKAEVINLDDWRLKKASQLVLVPVRTTAGCLNMPAIAINNGLAAVEFPQSVFDLIHKKTGYSVNFSGRKLSKDEALAFLHFMGSLGDWNQWDTGKDVPFDVVDSVNFRFAFSSLFIDLKKGTNE